MIERLIGTRPDSTMMPSMAGAVPFSKFSPAPVDTPEGMVPASLAAPPVGRFLRLVSNEELDARAQAEAAAQSLATEQKLIGNLESHCMREYRAAFDAKQVAILPKFHAALRALRCEYDEEKLAQIVAQGGTTIKMDLTAEKYYGALAWIMDLIEQDRPFDVIPTPLPDIPQEIMAEIEQQAAMELEMAQQMGLYPSPNEMRERVRQYRDEVIARAKQEAKRHAERQADVIDDAFTEGGWYVALEEAIEDGLALGTGFICGPDVRMEARMRWGSTPGQDEVVDEPVRFWYSPSSFDIYPSPGAKDVNDGHLTERLRWSRADLHSMIGVPGFKESAIRAALDQYGSGGLRNWMAGDQQRSVLEGRPNEQWSNTDALIEVARHWTRVPIKWLVEWGMTQLSVLDQDREQDVEVFFVGDHVIGVRTTEDPLKKRNLFKWKFRGVRGSFWGDPLAKSIESAQRMCDAAARAIADNMGLASGPMLEVETDRLAIGESVTKVYPWRIWQTVRNPNGSPGPAVRAIDVPINSSELMGVFQFFMNLADGLSGIPRYSYGMPETRGAATTSSGLAQLRSDAARGLKRIMGKVDRMIATSAEYTVRHLRRTKADPSIRGDVTLVGKGTTALIAREAEQQRWIELLGQTANPVDQQIFSPVRRANMWRSALKTFESADIDDIVPSEDEMQAQMVQQAIMGAMQAEAATGGPPQPAKTRQLRPGTGMVVGNERGLR